MGARGPARKPTALKLVDGTYRADRAPKNEPTPRIEAPSCPTWLHREAKREWRRIVKELVTLGLVSQMDRAALAAYCEAYAEWWQMDRVIKEDGEFFTFTTKGGDEYKQVHPAMAIKNAAIDRMKKFASEFGMTPAARTRVEAAERGESPADPADRFFS